ncbi:MAG TPA: hypothetical protein VFD84_08680 [Candidatus Binatia bacterium]|nr:hypothetical protein [Candidatus Binatia bacterium]
MLDRRPSLAALAVAVALAATGAAAEPLFTLADDGATFLYRARPGDTPLGVASMFGISPADTPAFMRENHIADATRIGTGFVYRVPNLAVRALRARTAALEARVGELAAARDRLDAERGAAARDAAAARTAAAAAEARAARLDRLATLWPFGEAAAALAVLLAAGALVVARGARRAERQAERFARALSVELDDRRRAALAERQESARRILDLESRVRLLEGQLGPRVALSGRGS